MRNEGVVHLSEASGVDFSKLTCVNEMKAAAADFEVVQRLEEILSQWCKEIEQVSILKIFLFDFTALIYYLKC